MADTNSSNPIVVVGGGVAGACSAALLAERGYQTILLDQDRFPRHKVCGEYVSGECWPLLERLGVTSELERRTNTWIEGISLFAPSGRKASLKLMKGRRALSISRYDLDEVLLNRAAASRVEIRQGCRVVDYESGRDEIVVRTSEGDAITSALVVAADGIRSKFSLEPIARRNGKRLFAFKAYFKGSEIRATEFEFFFTRHGYGGFSHIDSDTVNCAFLVEEDLVERFKGDCDAVYREGLLSNPAAQRKWGHAERISQWWTTGPVTFGTRTNFPPRVLPVGDAFTVTEQFAGEGMGMAVKNAFLLAEVLDGNGGMQDWEQICNRYFAAYRKIFGWKIRLLSSLRWAIGFPGGIELILAILGGWPWLFGMFYGLTRSDYAAFREVEAEAQTA